MPQRTLRFKIHQDGRVEETVEGFDGNACNSATKNVEDALGEVKVKNQTSEAFISCLLYTSPSPRDCRLSRMPSSA